MSKPKDNSEKINAANNASAERQAAIQKQIADDNRALQEQMFNKNLQYLTEQDKVNQAQVAKNQANYQPILDATRGSLGDLQSAGQANSWLTSAYDPSQLANDAGFKFRLAQGQQGIDNSAGASTGLLSSAYLKGTTEYNQGFASNEYQNAYAREMANRQNRYSALTNNANLYQNAAAGYAGVSTPSQLNSQLAGLTSQNADALSTINSSYGNAQTGIEANRNNAYVNALAAQQGTGGGMLGGALGGAAAGASAGTAILPGWGTAIGAVGGGIMGAFASRG